MMSYSSFCDDFYHDMSVNTELELPTQRDTILTFFERIQKQYPSMGNFYRRENSEYCLEEDRNAGQYRWVAMERDRVTSGVVNPSNLEEACGQHRLVLELIPYMLSVSPLDISSLDVTFAMDFDYSGNHDEVIAEALFGGTAFANLLELPCARAVGFSPAVVVALSDDCRTQARISVESKTSVCEPRPKDPVDDTAITLSFTVRQYRGSAAKFDPLKSLEMQCRLAKELMNEKIMPGFVKPLADVIAQKRLS
jgi:hypothetical protein